MLSFFLFYILQSLLTRVLHVEVADASPEMKSVVVSETKKKDDTKLKEKPQEKLERGMIEKEISRDYKPVSSTKICKYWKYMLIVCKSFQQKTLLFTKKEKQTLETFAHASYALHFLVLIYDDNGVSCLCSAWYHR